MDSRTELDQLGTVLMVWAHPDDEAYLAGGLSAALAETGQRVVCVTATRGEAGESSLPVTDSAHLRSIRTAELEEALALLGVGEHHWLDYPDGGCAEVDATEAADRVAALVAQVRPDTVVTFGPDGFTGHPDHRAVSRWTDLALERLGSAGGRPRLLHAVTTDEDVDWEIAEEYGVFYLGRPRICTVDEVALRLVLAGDHLDRKVAALARQRSQTGGIICALGLERFRDWVSAECFGLPEAG